MGANVALNIGPSKGTMHVIFAALKTVCVFAPCVDSEPTRSKIFDVEFEMSYSVSTAYRQCSS